MVETSQIVSRVLLLFLMVIPGYLLRKANIIDGQSKVSRGLSDIVIYVSQPAMIIYGYITDFSREILFNCLGVLVCSIGAHFFFFGIAKLLFRKESKEKQAVLRFSTVFSNAGFMGIPLIESLLGATAAVYAAIYLISFNFFCWSVGCMMFTGDRKYMSVKKILINPATVPTFIGLIFFLLPINAYIPSVACEGLEMLKATVAPLSMMVIGIRLAESDIKSSFKDKNLPLYVFVRMIFFPAVVWGLMRLLSFCGIYESEIATTVMLILASTPTATMACMFAEKFGGDAVYASKIVSVSTVFSIVTMPFLALLLTL